MSRAASDIVAGELVFVDGHGFYTVVRFDEGAGEHGVATLELVQGHGAVTIYRAAVKARGGRVVLPGVRAATDAEATGVKASPARRAALRASAELRARTRIAEAVDLALRSAELSPATVRDIVRVELERQAAALTAAGATVASDDDYRARVRRTFQAMSDEALAFQSARIVGGIDREEVDLELGRRRSS